MSVNKAILIGNLGQDAETRYTPSGSAVTNISIATTNTWKDSNGNKQEKTSWHKVTFFGKLAEIAGEYLRKGGQVYIEGRIDYSDWTDKEGVKRQQTQIIADQMRMLGKREDGNSEPRREPAKEPQRVAGTKPSDMDDDIPFN